MIDQPAPFDSAEETAAREEAPVVNVARMTIARRPMTASEAAAAFLHAAFLIELERL